MRIGLNLLFLKPGKVGGTQTYSQSLIDAFSIVGKNHEFILFLNLECKDLFNHLPSNFTRVICNIPGNIRPLRVLYEQIILPFKLLKYKIDLLHSLGQTTPILASCPSVITIFDTNYWTCAEYFLLLERLFAQTLVRQAVFSSSHIIAISCFTRNELVNRLHVNQKKITPISLGAQQIPQGISTREEYTNLLKKYGVTSPFLLTVASPWKHKNVAGLIEVYRELLGLGDAPKLVIVGHSVEKMPEVAKELRTLNKPEKIIFTGYVKYDDLPAFYQNAEVFVFPSLYEGFGLPILEAMAYGVPVVSSNTASLPEVAGDAALLANPKDPVGFAKQIRRILDDENLRNELSRRGKERAREFTWEKTARETISIYEKIACV